MQPSWRKEGDLLVCKTQTGEDWQALRKGGTAGIYIVVMGLSWWIKAQCIHDSGIDDSGVDAWAAVSDILWVIEQMKKYP